MESRRKQFEGKVVSIKTDKSCVVEIEKLQKHALYGKYSKNSKKYMIHDPENTCKVGDKVQFEECAPISKRKRWQLVQVLSRVEE